MASEFILNQSEESWLSTIASIYDIREESEGDLKIVVTNASKRTLNQNSLQHCIYSELSKYLIKKGRSDCNPDWVKKMLKNKFLGWTQEAFTDILTGEVTHREVLIGTSSLGRGEATIYTTQILEWADSIGCEIKIPARCDYRDAIMEQNA